MSIDSYLPCEWNERDRSPLLEVVNSVGVKYKGRGEKIDAGSIRANRPIPAACGLYYYEVTIKNKGKKGYIGIGLCCLTSDLAKLPGWEDTCSYGYHGDDGNAFGGTGSGEKYGPQFTTGDTVGCCVDFMEGSCFFTKNGAKLKTAFRNVGQKKGGGEGLEPMYPCVGLQSVGEEVVANFGQQPFVFDLDSYRSSLELKAAQQVQQIEFVAPKWQGTINQLVVSYLAHHGYHETASILAKDTGATMAVSLESIQTRCAIKDLILAGQIDQAIAKVTQISPAFFNDNATLMFRLTCRKFVETVAARQGGGTGSGAGAGDAAGGGASGGAANDDQLGELLALGQELQMLFDKLQSPGASDQVLLQDAFSLLAYTNLAECPVAALLQTSHRTSLAKELNSAMLVAGGQPPEPPLERLVSHTGECLKEMRSQGHGEAAFIRLEHFA